ncbi:TPA: hypothetical protein ACGOVD_000202 [Streptococcus suis]
MAKWTEFLSGLKQERNRIDSSNELTLADKLLLLNQLYSIITIPGKNYIGGWAKFVRKLIYRKTTSNLI